MIARVAKPFNVRTRVHEYAGGAWTVAGLDPAGAVSPSALTAFEEKPFFEQLWNP
jgi:hypothetical protein